MCCVTRRKQSKPSITQESKQKSTQHMTTAGTVQTKPNQTKLQCDTAKDTSNVLHGDSSTGQATPRMPTQRTIQPQEAAQPHRNQTILQPDKQCVQLQWYYVHSTLTTHRLDDERLCTGACAIHTHIHATSQYHRSHTHTANKTINNAPYPCNFWTSTLAQVHSCVTAKCTAAAWNAL